MSNYEYDVSIIIPVYNVENYLNQCIESVLNQTKKEYEIILIDDGSNDGSTRICKQYEVLKNVSLIIKKNEGQGIARNIGISLAKGKYIYFIDSDDFIDPNTIENLYGIAEKDHLEVICFAANIFYEGMTLENTFSEVDDCGFKDSDFLCTVHNGLETFNYLLKEKEYLTSAPRRFFLKEFLEKNNLKFPEYIIHEDEVFGYMSMILAERIMCIPNKYYFRRVRENSTMTAKSYLSSAEGYLYTWDKLNSFIEEQNWSELNKNNSYKFCENLLLTVFNMYSIQNKENRNQFKKLLNKYEKALDDSLKKYSLLVKLFVKHEIVYVIMYRIYKFLKMKGKI